jgi:hypothetical protein
MSTRSPEPFRPPTTSDGAIGSRRFRMTVSTRGEPARPSASKASAWMKYLQS